MIPSTAIKIASPQASHQTLSDDEDWIVLETDTLPIEEPQPRAKSAPPESRQLCEVPLLSPRYLIANRETLSGTERNLFDSLYLNIGNVLQTLTDSTFDLHREFKAENETSNLVIDDRYLRLNRKQIDFLRDKIDFYHLNHLFEEKDIETLNKTIVEIILGSAHDKGSLIPVLPVGSLSKEASYLFPKEIFSNGKKVAYLQKISSTDEYVICFDWRIEKEQLDLLYLKAGPLTDLLQILELLATATSQDQLHFDQESQQFRIKNAPQERDAVSAILSIATNTVTSLTSKIFRYSSSEEDSPPRSPSNEPAPENPFQTLEKFFSNQKRYVQELCELVKEDDLFIVNISWHVYYAYRGLLRLEKHFLDQSEYTKSEQIKSVYQILSKLQMVLTRKKDLPAAGYYEYFEKVCNALQRLNNEEGLKWKIERYLKFIQRVHNFIPAVYIEIFEEQGEKIFHDLRSGKIESEDPLQQEMQKLVLEAFTGFDEKVKPRRSLRPVEFSVSLTDLEHNDETLLSIRNCCDALLQAFRKCTQLAASRNDKWAAAADLLAWKIFTQIDFSEFFHRTMKRFDEIERSVDPWQPQIVLVNQRFNPSLFFHEFDRVKENLSSLPSEVTTHFLDRMAKSIYKGLGNVDPLFDDKNFPNIVFSCSRGNEKPPVRAIAFGTPTTYKAETPSSNNPVQYVAPEFIAAIRTFQRKGLTYLVCIRQDMIPSITNLFEWKRVEAQLEFEKTIKETVYSYVTSMDTEFYKQSGIWEDKCQSTNFKKALISEFFTNPSDETGNYYSEKTRDKYKKLKQDSLDLIEEIHKIVFNSKTVLSQQERCAYHDLFTSFQKIAICHNISADYLSDICRDTCDRSMLSLVLLLTLLSIVSGDIEKPWFAQNFYSTFFFRALSALKRLTQEKRVARCKQTLEIFFQHREEIRELFKKIFPGMTLAPQQYI